MNGVMAAAPANAACAYIPTSAPRVNDGQEPRLFDGEVAVLILAGSAQTAQGVQIFLG